MEVAGRGEWVAMRIMERGWSSWPLRIVLLGLVAYWPGFEGVFVFDDLPWIVDNDDLQHLWPPWAAARGTTRPLLFFTLAINHAVSGLNPWSYHVVNFGIHLMTALLLFGVLHRTLQRKQFAPCLQHVRPQDLAGATALLWVVHPLTTQAVTYVIQRGESLASLFYVLCFYCLLRSDSSAEAATGRAMEQRDTDHTGNGNTRIAWWILIVFSWWAGMATKLIAVTLPLSLILFDWIVLTGNYRTTWKCRRGLYVALCGPIVVGVSLLLLWDPSQLAAQVRGDAQTFTRWDYLISQPGVVMHYLQLVVWPRPLMIDHGWLISDLTHALGPIVVICLILGAFVYGMFRGNPLCFLGIWFAGILAPTSSLVPLRDVLVEHRMYLPLVAPLFLLVWFGASLPLRVRRYGLGMAVVVLMTTTFQRNQDYHSELSLFASGTQESQNERRFYNLQLEFVFDEGGVLDGPLLSLVETGEDLLPAARALQTGDAETALQHLSHRSTAPAANLRGLALWMSGRDAEAAMSWASAGMHPAARVNLAVAVWLDGDLDGAERILAEQVSSTQPEAHYNLGALLARTGRLTAAREPLVRAVTLRPGFKEAVNNLGAIAEGEGNRGEAALLYDQAVAAGHVTSKVNRALLHVRQRSYREAQPLLDQIVTRSDGFAPRAAGARALSRYFTGDLHGAVDDLRLARRSGGSAALDNNLGCVQMALGDLSLAQELFEAALSRDPEQTAAHHNLGKLLVILGDPAKAVAHLLHASARRPHDQVLKANLRQAQRLSRAAR